MSDVYLGNPEFAAWWEQVVQRLRDCGFDELPTPSGPDYEAFEDGTDPESWSFVYYDPDEEDTGEELDDLLELTEEEGGLRPNEPG